MNHPFILTYIRIGDGLSDIFVPSCCSAWLLSHPLAAMINPALTFVTGLPNPEPSRPASGFYIAWHLDVPPADVMAARAEISHAIFFGMPPKASFGLTHQVAERIFERSPEQCFPWLCTIQPRLFSDIPTRAEVGPRVYRRWRLVIPSPLYSLPSGHRDILRPSVPAVAQTWASVRRMVRLTRSPYRSKKLTLCAFC